MSGKQLSAEYLHQMVVNALMAHNTSEENANSVAEALIYAEMNGLTGHGLSRLPSYCAQAASGKVDGHAVPEAYRVAEAAIRIDARFGFAFKALALAVDNLCNLVPKTGIAVAAITHSHHCGAAGYHVEALARKGLVGLMFSNTPMAIAPWGGKTGVFGTNPIAFAAPRKEKTLGAYFHRGRLRETATPSNNLSESRRFYHLWVWLSPILVDSWIDKTGTAFTHAMDDFLAVSHYLVIGAFTAALAQTYVDRSSFLSLSSTPILSVVLMMALAILLNLCSEADAFIAASFRGLMPAHAQMASMLTGPMFDLKPLLMYQSVFRRRAIVVLSSLILAAVLVVAVGLGVLTGMIL